MRRWQRWLVLNVHVTLDGIMFYSLLFYPFVDGIMDSKVSICPHIFYVVIMCVFVKGGIFEFIGHRCTKNWMMFCDSHQDWFYFVAMYNTQIPHVNLTKKFRWEGIKLCAIFGGTRLFSQESGSFYGGTVMSREEVNNSRGLDPFITNDVDTCRYQFLILSPSGHGALKITR